MDAKEKYKADRMVNYTDAMRFIEYIFTSGRHDIIERVIELERQNSDRAKINNLNSQTKVIS